MKVKIGQTLHDSCEEIIMLILDDTDKFNISTMKKDDKVYCCYPLGTKSDEVERFMHEQDKKRLTDFY